MSRFMYGYSAETIFQQTFPEAKKLVAQADFRLGDFLVEIGRSRILEKRVIVYYRKIFYNIKKEHHKKDKKKNPIDFHQYLINKNCDKYINHPKDFLFIYFTKNLKFFVMFSYEDLLKSELKKNKTNGEYYFNLRARHLYKTKDLYKVVCKRLGYKGEKCNICEDDFGVWVK